MANPIDEAAQFEHVGAVAFPVPVPVPEEMPVALPFVVVGFHAGKGSEYINHRVGMLNRLHVPNFTK